MSFFDATNIAKEIFNEMKVGHIFQVNYICDLWEEGILLKMKS